MKLGIDIDNVISDFNTSLLKDYIKHDKELRNTGIINKNASYIREGMFDWTDEEELTYYKNNIERITASLKPIKDAKKYIDKLHEDGHSIYIISGRDNGDYKDPYNLTEKWLKENNIYYDELILVDFYSNHGKLNKCLEYNVDILLDDSIRLCSECIKGGVNAVLMNTDYNHDSSLERVNSWKEFYNYISNYKSKKINVILDTDASNECDDQFAISYMLKNQNIFNVEAITIAPFSHKSKGVFPNEGQEISYKEISKLCNLIKFNTKNKLFKGSTDYIQNGYDEDSDAVNKIIETALRNEKTYIMSIGALTNVALAINKEPRIINKIELIWLGGNELGFKDNWEYNFRQDIDAVKVVFDSKVKLTILPCENVVSELKININELKENLNTKSSLCNYLISKFYNDGFHGVEETRVIWDISVIAYLINKKWFKSKTISCPNIKDDSSYEFTKNQHEITFITKLNRNEIYKDLFEKLK